MKPTQQTMCHRSGTIYQPTNARYKRFCTNFNYPWLKCEQAWRCDAMHKYVRDLPACVWETPLLTWSWWWWWTSSSDTRPTSCRCSGSTTLLCSWGRDTVLYATKTWLQKKESWIISKLAVPSRRMGALLRKREAPATISTPATAADIVATVHYVVAVCLRNYICIVGAGVRMRNCFNVSKVYNPSCTAYFRYLGT